MDNSPIRVVIAATLVCLRQSRTGSMQSWDVLLGQGEVKNWLRSTAETTRIMRYPGEWKFPGGVVDELDESLEATALRELEEEFLGIKGHNARIYFLCEKITREIQKRRHRMFNFVALAEENSTWLTDEVVQRTNEALAFKREMFERHIVSGDYWKMTEDEKMVVSPEINRIQWFPIDEAISMMGASLTAPQTPLDDWQRQEFAKYSVLSRDPMFISMQVLKEIAQFETRDALRAFVKTQQAPSLVSLIISNSNL